MPYNLDDFERIPGLFQQWDLSRALTHDAVWLVLPAGHTDNGEPLFTVFREMKRTEAVVEAAP
jgi:hypothetical protein